MKFYGKAEDAANSIIKAFQNPNALPQPLARLFIKRKDSVPCRSWSWRNQLIVAVHGYVEARGFRQWEQVGRQVKKGEKAFHILGPLKKTIEDTKTGKERTIIYGFKGIPVFGFEQTAGKALPTSDPQADRWIDSLPLVDVARAWGLTVETYNGERASALGQYRRGKGIALGVKNLSTWLHELVHAADHRNGKLTELGQHWRSEIVAELGGAVLLRIFGKDHDADLGGCWEYVKHYADKAGIQVVEACGKVLDRTCEAVALILDTAEKLVCDDEISKLLSEKNEEATHI